MIVHDARNPVAVAHADTLRAALDGDPLPELTVVIGGDGFLLHTIHDLGFDRLYVGLNAGRVGFLLNDVADWGRAARSLRAAEVVASEFPLIEATFEGPDGALGSAVAVNDFYLERASGQTARLRLTVDGAVVVESLVADGIIVSTALGSTAYNFSAGGPPCHPSLQVLTVTPICPHLPRLSPFALPRSARIEVEVQHGDRRPVRGVADGRDVGPVRRLALGYGPRRLRLGYFAGHDFTSRMVRKILHP
jgi:NAD+ kinase